MTTTTNQQRRRLLGLAAAGAIVTAAGPAAALVPAPARFGPIRQVRAGLLDVGYVELGPASGTPVVLLHGWPYDIHSFEEVAPLLAAAGYRVVVPWLRGHGSTRFLSDATLRNGQQAAVALDIIALMDALDIRRAILAGFDWGARTADIIAALWPERCKALVSVNGYLVNNLERNQLPLAPTAEKGWWYQYYFATERGRAGYAANRRAFNQLIWRDNSPRWHPDEATYARTAAAFDNPDHVDVVIHNYRWRLGIAPGEARYDALERRLAAAPTIGVPAITLDGDADGVTPATDGSAQAARFTERRTHRIVAGAGHNLPQEAPRAFADAVIEVDRY